MDEDDVPQFSNAEEEIQYWKELSLLYKQRSQDAHDELEEFQENSRELERELEAQLDQAEAQIRELRSINTRLQRENEVFRDKIEQSNRQNHTQIAELQSEVSRFRVSLEDRHRYIRQLEQSNDDLERAKRALIVSLEDFEVRTNSAIERNAFLESELDEKESLKTMVQRLKDEARDLKQELNIRELDIPDNDKCLERVRSPIDSNKLTVEMETQTAPGSPLKIAQNGTQPVPLTPSARISALNIVGDLLRKVGALESKLASCRNFVKENPPGDASNKDTYRGRRPNRGAANPTVQSLIRT